MKQYWTKIELTNSWSLSQGEICYLEKKDNKLVCALKMRYFDLQGYLPKKVEDITLVAIDYVASQLSIVPNRLVDYDWQSRIAQIHNAEIRKYYGFKKLEPADLLSIKEFIETNLLVQGLSIGQINDEVYKFLKKAKVEPSANNEISRYISDNIQSPLYKAILELGRAVRTIYVAGTYHRKNYVLKSKKL